MAGRNNPSSPKKHTNPSSDPGLRFHISVASWIDLRGYGDMINSVNFDPLDPKATEALKRLRTFHGVVARHSDKAFPTLVVNDGAVAYRDLDFDDREIPHDFLMRSWELFREVNKKDKAFSRLGAKMILACGFRVKGRRAGQAATEEAVADILERLKAGKITKQKAIQRIVWARARFDVIPQLQANFAFTKAYCADQAGSRANLGGPYFYVDSALFERDLPTWLHADRPVRWTDPGLANLTATFLPIREIEKHDPPGVEDAPLFRDGYSVSTAIGADTAVLDAVRKVRTRNA